MSEADKVRAREFGFRAILGRKQRCAMPRELQTFLIHTPFAFTVLTDNFSFPRN